MGRAGSAAYAALILVLMMATGCGSPDREAERIALGRHVFFDAGLSADGRTSCASCHRPELAFTDGLARSNGSHGGQGTRNAPSLLDAVHRPLLFWDGREADLNQAVLQPFTNPVEMGLRSEQELTRRFSASRANLDAFKAAFGPAAPDAASIGLALAAFLRSLPASDSAFARHRAGQKDALAGDALEGLRLFAGKAGCVGCHVLEDGSLTDDRFHHLGISDRHLTGRIGATVESLGERPASAALILQDARVAALGRFAITREASQIGAFRTPSLRNVARTAPYMHDGSVGTLEGAVEQEVYYRGLTEGRPGELTVAERQQLIAFLRSLSDK